MGCPGNLKTSVLTSRTSDKCPSRLVDAGRYRVRGYDLDCTTVDPAVAVTVVHTSTGHSRRAIRSRRLTTERLGLHFRFGLPLR